MALKIPIKKLANLLYKVLLLHTFVRSRKEKIFFKESDFLVVTIAYNNLETIKIQHSLITTNLVDDFNYLIADNSNDKNISEKIELFCTENTISYVKIPRNPLSNIRASGSHGIALNWSFVNIVEKYKPKFWGFLDHDIFPIKKTEILKHIKIGLWGAIRSRGTHWWYLWPGFCFFEREKTKQYKFDFSPYHAGVDGLTFLDTGGSNYNSIYKKIDRKSIDEAETKLIDIRTKKEFKKGDDSSQVFEIIDKSWLHLRQIAWRKESSNKISQQEAILDVANLYIN